MTDYLTSPLFLLRNTSFLFPLRLLPRCHADDPDIGDILSPVPGAGDVSLDDPDARTLVDVLTEHGPALSVHERHRQETHQTLAIVHIAPLAFRDILQTATGPGQPERAALATRLLTLTTAWQRPAVTVIELQLPQRHRALQVEQQIWGHEARAYPPSLRHRARCLTQDRCDFCGWTSVHNPLVFRDGNPENTADANLGVACPLCVAGQHLSQLGANDGVMVYLPAFPPEDLSHLLRTVILTLESGDETRRHDARGILRWLTAHRAECETFWGTSHPGEFGEALLRADERQRDDLQQRLRHVALIPNPDHLTGHPALQSPGTRHPH